MLSGALPALKLCRARKKAEPVRVRPASSQENTRICSEGPLRNRQSEKSARPQLPWIDRRGQKLCGAIRGREPFRARHQEQILQAVYVHARFCAFREAK